MRKMLVTTALGATIVLGGPQLAAQAAPTDSATPVATATATASQTVQTTTTTTVDHKDYTGLWGLVGLLGLAGLIPRKRKETHVVRPAHTETRVATRPAETHHTTPADNHLGETTHVNCVTDTLDDGLNRGTDTNGKRI